MPLDQTSSPEVSGIKISIAPVTNGVAGTSKVIGHLDSFGTLIDKTRNTTKYTPLNNTQYEEIVSLGSLTQAAYSMSVLYDPEGQEGINLLEAAIDNNTTVQIIIELNNAITVGGHGTKIEQISKVSSFKVNGEKDGKYKADFSAEKIGLPVITQAS